MKVEEAEEEEEDDGVEIGVETGVAGGGGGGILKPSLSIAADAGFFLAAWISSDDS